MDKGPIKIYADLLRAFHAELILHDRAEIILMAQDIPHNRLNVLENQPFQDFDTDEMPIAFLFVLSMRGNPSDFSGNSGKSVVY